MKLKSFDYNQWLSVHEWILKFSSNAPERHRKSWYREMVPWDVLMHVEFGSEFVGLEQNISLQGVNYKCRLTSCGDDGGYYAADVLIDSSDLFQHMYEKWVSTYFFNKYRVVYKPDFTLHTVYSPGEGKGDAEVKRLFERFEARDFELVLQLRSFPMVLFLAKHLIGLRCEQIAKTRGGSFETSFDTRDGVFPEFSGYSFENIGHKYRPFFSIGRSYWVVFSFSEERAHRIAIDMERHCENGAVVFLNPSFDRHHRSRKISVLSLLEFCHQGQGSSLPYFRQVFLLQNFLNLPDGSVGESNEDSSLCERDAYDREIRELLTMIKIVPFDEDSFFYILTCFNLLNAYTKQVREKHSKYKGAYQFKKRLLPFLIQAMNSGVRFNVNFEINESGKDFALRVGIRGYVFGFRHIRLVSAQLESLEALRNAGLLWPGVELQPIAPWLLKEGRKALLTRT